MISCCPISYDVYKTGFCLTDDNPDNVKDKVRRLPQSLSESVEALEEDTVLRDLIGEKLLVAIEGVRKVLTDFHIFPCVSVIQF